MSPRGRNEPRGKRAKKNQKKNAQKGSKGVPKTSAFAAGAECVSRAVTKSTAGQKELVVGNKPRRKRGKKNQEKNTQVVSKVLPITAMTVAAAECVSAVVTTSAAGQQKELIVCKSERGKVKDDLALLRNVKEFDEEYTGPSIFDNISKDEESTTNKMEKNTYENMSTPSNKKRRRRRSKKNTEQKDCITKSANNDCKIVNGESDDSGTTQDFQSSSDTLQQPASNQKLAKCAKLHTPTPKDETVGEHSDETSNFEVGVNTMSQDFTTLTSNMNRGNEIDDGNMNLNQIEIENKEEIMKKDTTISESNSTDQKQAKKVGFKKEYNITMDGNIPVIHNVRHLLESDSSSSKNTSDESEQSSQIDEYIVNDENVVENDDTRADSGSNCPQMPSERESNQAGNDDSSYYERREENTCSWNNISVNGTHYYNVPSPIVYNGIYYLPLISVGGYFLMPLVYQRIPPNVFWQDPSFQGINYLRNSAAHSSHYNAPFYENSPPTQQRTWHQQPMYANEMNEDYFPSTNEMPYNEEIEETDYYPCEYENPEDTLRRPGERGVQLVEVTDEESTRSSENGHDLESEVGNKSDKAEESDGSKIHDEEEEDEYYIEDGGEEEEEEEEDNGDYDEEGEEEEEEESDVADDGNDEEESGRALEGEVDFQEIKETKHSDGKEENQTLEKKLRKEKKVTSAQTKLYEASLELAFLEYKKNNNINGRDTLLLKTIQKQKETCSLESHRLVLKILKLAVILKRSRRAKSRFSKI